MGKNPYQDGMSRLEAGDVEQARRLLEEAYRRAPGSVEVLHGLARALDLAGERARALELLEGANAKAPTEPGPACDLAMLYLEQEEDVRAERVLRPVLEAHPEHPRANLHLAMALASTEPARARGHAEKALQERDPEGRQQAEMLLRVLSAQVGAGSAIRLADEEKDR